MSSTSNDPPAGLAAENERLRQELEEERARYQFMMDAVGLGDWDMDIRANRTRRSARHDAVFGYDEMLETWGYDDFLAHVHENDRSRVHEAYQRALAGEGSYDIEFRIRRADDEVRWVWSAGHFILDEAGAPLRAAGVVSDITERRETESRLNQLAREESLGRLAAGVAHDFNNQLTVLVGTLSVLLDDPDLPEPMADDVRYLLTDAEHAARSVQGLLAVARDTRTNFEVVDLAEWLSGLRVALRHLAGPRIDVDLHTRADRPATVRMDRARFEHVVFNLAANARDAMPHGGRLALRVESRERSVRLVVQDEGLGMDAETLRRCTEAFFTTKPVGKGTGLGLASVHRFTREMNGELHIESTVGVGTRVSIDLPRVAAPSKIEPSAAGARPRRADGNGTDAAEALEGVRVLVVDDDPRITTVCARLLRRAGADVVTADRGEDAVAAFATSDDPGFDLLITDIVMPTIGGLAVAEAVHSRAPDVPILLISGYTDEDLGSFGLDRRGWNFIPKPFQPRELIRRVTALVRD